MNFVLKVCKLNINFILLILLVLILFGCNTTSVHRLSPESFPQKSAEAEVDQNVPLWKFHIVPKGNTNLFKNRKHSKKSWQTKETIPKFWI